MTSQIPKSLLLLFSLCLGLWLYWPSMNGQPVWDDISYLFKYNVIVGDFPNSTIWKEFSWPLSVSAHKFLFRIWEHEYLYYHLLNFFLHFINSVLILKITEKLKLPFARLLFIFFFFHPANVISVSWMIQLKTLLCLFFALLSFQSLIKAESDNKWFALSWLLFAMSLLSKSASISIPFFFLFFLKKKLKGKKFLWLLPFFLMSLVSGLKIMNSPVTTEAIKGLESKKFGTNKKIFKPIDAENPERKKTDNKTGLQSEALPQPKDEKRNVLKTIISRAENVFAMSYFYFWQTLLPIENAPIKGLKYDGPGVIEFIHFIFIILVVLINIKTSVPLYLLIGHLMLLPFLGIFPAPYMNLTWVSDQHLYLALPFFLCFWFSLLTRWKMKYASLLPIILIPLYFYKVRVTTPYYKNDIDFFRASLDADALNVPIAYNLAMAYLEVGNLNQAMNITSTMVSMSKVSSEVLNNRYFPYIFLLNSNLHQVEFNKKEP